MDTLLRQITMLGLIPRRAPGVTTAGLQSALATRDFRVDLRTIQRDLVKLSVAFPLICDESDRPRWYWAPHAVAVSLPGHDSLSALSWHLVEQHLQPLLPRSLLQEIAPHFQAARGYLERVSEGNLRRWSQRVRILPRHLQLEAPDTPVQVLDVVYQGLLHRQQIEVVYASRAREEPRVLTLHPLALVVRDSAYYLLATVFDFTDIRQLVLHRMKAARLIDEASNEPQGFDLDSYIREGGFDYARGHQVWLVARFDASAAKNLLETPLTPDQTHIELEDGRVEIQAMISDSERLRWWLKAFGPEVEVVEPENLRQSLREDAEKVLRRYAS